MCMNVAKLDGGVAFNVIPDEATLTISVRPPPGVGRRRGARRAVRARARRAAARAAVGADVESVVPHARRLARSPPALGHRRRRSISPSGPRRRCSPLPASIAWSTDRATSRKRTRPTSSCPSPISSARATTFAARPGGRGALTMEPADVVLRFLESVGSRRESDFYLALFRAGEPERFAAISVDANVARHAARSGRARAALPRRARALSRSSLLGVFESTEAMEQGTRLARRLEKAGVRAVVIGSEEPDLLARAAEAARGQTIPIVVFPGRCVRRGSKRSARSSRRCARASSSSCIARAGLRQNGELVPLVNLTTDDAALAHVQGAVAQGARARRRIAQARRAHAASAVGRHHLAAQPVPRALHHQGRRHAAPPRRRHRAPPLRRSRSRAAARAA